MDTVYVSIESDCSVSGYDARLFPKECGSWDFKTC